MRDKTVQYIPGLIPVLLDKQVRTDSRFFLIYFYFTAFIKADYRRQSAGKQVRNCKLYLFKNSVCISQLYFVFDRTYHICYNHGTLESV